jgi:hypothetical protein
MATSKKIIFIDNNKIDIVTTNYNKDFINNINRQGRKKHDYELLSDEQLKRCINQKIKTLKQYNNKLNYIRDNNSFNVFITIRGINRLGLKRFIDRTRKADKNLAYVTLASWSIKMDLHYHIILNTSLSKKELEDKLKNIDAKIEIIYNQKKLLKYFKKNLNYDTIHILKQINNKELRSKQVEILNYSKILCYSRNIKHKPKIIKNPSQKQLQEVYNNATYLETIEYKNIDSTIQIDKFEK